LFWTPVLEGVFALNDFDIRAGVLDVKKPVTVGVVFGRAVLILYPVLVLGTGRALVVLIQDSIDCLSQSRTAVVREGWLAILFDGGALIDGIGKTVPVRVRIRTKVDPIDNFALTRLVVGVDVRQQQV